MGIITPVIHSILPQKYRKYRLIPTRDGVSASVYLLDDCYVLKLFEKETPALTIENEILLLSKIDGLPLPKIVDHFILNGAHAIVYTQIRGKSIQEPADEHIRQIALFLKAFHIQSRHISIKHTERFARSKLKKQIDATGHPKLQHYLPSTELHLKKEGVIHGDLFPDNCKFVSGRLSGVYDFSDICIGDFHFDLAVIAASWCFDKTQPDPKKVEILLDYYGSSIDRVTFYEYIKYALLHYTVQRLVSKRDCAILLGRLDNLC
ncbi:Homoserine kinase [hydrothermal vent metagenome]|uniref:Homoserine kinase n=1 Tax=hydrothermal vent metagenome TaxID=652676 RepID=A0A1W1CTG8_9ZZZZ